MAVTRSQLPGDWGVDVSGGHSVQHGKSAGMQHGCSENRTSYLACRDRFVPRSRELTLYLWLSDWILSGRGVPTMQDHSGGGLSTEQCLGLIETYWVRSTMFQSGL